MFITLEGPEGSGKTSQIPPLAAFLKEQGYSIITTREPGGTEIGDQVREVLFNLGNTRMNPRTEILLFLAARAQLVEERIRPVLAQGTIVLCDRYADSTLAYQGYGHAIDLDTLRQLLRFTTGDLWPDLTVLLDIDPEAGLRRRRSGGGWNRLDAYDLSFHQRVAQGYREMARQEPKRWVTVDASQPFDTVQSQIREIIVQRLSTRIASNAI